MGKLMNLLKWVDDNLLKLFLIVFIFLIPIYPKLPSVHVEYTYIYIRVDDFFIAFYIFIFFLQLMRRKIALKKEYLLLFILFWAAAFLSFLYGHYIQKTIPVFNIGFLHASRRIEYMMTFFIAFATIKSKKDFFFFLKLIMLALVMVGLYGIGQKFLGFPAVQTMNPEFARGHILYLTPEARVSSTFAGHYDLAAYLVFLLPIVLAFSIWKKSTVYFLIFMIGLFTLTLTASRISSIAYMVSISAFLVFLKKWKLLIVVLIFSIGLSFLSNNLISRFVKTFQVKQIFVNDKTGQVVVPQKISTKELPAGSFYVQIKDNKNTVQQNAADNALLQQTILDQYRDVARKEGKILTATEEANIMATASANLRSVNTVISDISLATRLQVEWPRAFNAFLKNPILGTGPSSITESTDSDYLRWIGEFGALGTSLFLLILYSINKFIMDSTKKLSKPDKLLYYGFTFGFIGLMINAMYIDVFEASKVAYYFWMVTGIFVASLYLLKKKEDA